MGKYLCRLESDPVGNLYAEVEANSKEAAALWLARDILQKTGVKAAEVLVLSSQGKHASGLQATYDPVKLRWLEGDTVATCPSLVKIGEQ